MRSVLLITACALCTTTRADTIAVYPPSVSLETALDHQVMTVIATNDDGETREVTGESTFTLAEPLAEIHGSILHPLADGKTQLTVTWSDQTATLAVKVVNAADARPVSFRLDVLPVLTVAGCNSGACHGSARGQDGFRLSLFGFDPAGDAHRLTREFPGRRLDTSIPAHSLLLEKASGAVPHTGGKRFERDGDLYNTVRRWIAAGAPEDPADLPHATGIELFPPAGVITGAGRQMQMTVRASYSDGTDRDVTRLAVYRTNNALSAAVDPGGFLTSGKPGEAFVTASFGVFTVGSPFIVLPAEGDFEFYDPAEGTLVASDIDDLANAKLRKLRMTPSPLCTDEAFVRRVYLDLIGLAPTPAERQAFLEDPAPDKRAKLVDTLLERREFVELLVMQWAELLQIRSNNQISRKAALLFFEWVRSRIMADVSLDQLVRELLTATGGTFKVPATNFYQNQADTLVLAENVAQAFMGIRVQCAQCHNHPFDRWTQDDYYGFAAFFSQVGRKRGEDPRETIVFDRRSGDVQHPVGNRVMPPKFLGGGIPDVRGKDRRAVLAEWLTSAENPWFARSLANRMWAHFMGVGIVEPVDDFRVSNPASNEPLLDLLASKLVASDYDMKQLVRDITGSRAYQRSTIRNESNRNDERNFAHALVRRIRAETLLDVVCQVTSVPEKFPGLPLGARAVEIADGTTSNYFLTTFGRARRDTVCACEVSREPSLSQALHLLNGATVNAKIVQGKVIETLIAEGKTPAEILDVLYLRCLSRMPTDEEREKLLVGIAESENPAPLFHDVFWALLNSSEFIFNH